MSLSSFIGKKLDFCQFTSYPKWVYDPEKMWNESKFFSLIAASKQLSGLKLVLDKWHAWIFFTSDTISFILIRLSEKVIRMISLSPKLSIVKALTCSFSLLCNNSSVHKRIACGSSIPVPMRNPLFKVSRVIPING